MFLGCSLRSWLKRRIAQAEAWDSSKDRAWEDLEAKASSWGTIMARTVLGRIFLAAFSAMWRVSVMVGGLAMLVGLLPLILVQETFDALAEHPLGQGRFSRTSKMFEDAGLMIEFLGNCLVVGLMWALAYPGLSWLAMGFEDGLGRHWSSAVLSPKLPGPALWRAAYSNVFEIMILRGRNHWTGAHPGPDGLGRLRAMGLSRMEEREAVRWAALPIGLCGMIRCCRWPWATPLDVIKDRILDEKGQGALPQEQDWFDWVQSAGLADRLHARCPPGKASLGGPRL